VREQPVLKLGTFQHLQPDENIANSEGVVRTGAQQHKPPMQVVDVQDQVHSHEDAPGERGNPGEAGGTAAVAPCSAVPPLHLHNVPLLCVCTPCCRSGTMAHVDDE